MLRAHLVESVTVSHKMEYLCVQRAEHDMVGVAW